MNAFTPMRAEADLLAQETYSFETHVLRGRYDREWPVECSYQIQGGKAVLTKWCIIGDTWPLTSRELEQLDQEAAEHASLVLADIELDVAAPSEGRAWGRAAA